MADELNRIDKSYRPTVSGVTNDANKYITVFKFDSAQERLLVESTGTVTVTGGATEAKQDDIISAINSNFPTGYANKIVESGDYTYICLADPGSDQADAVWQCKRIDESVAGTTIITWADGNKNFDNVATDPTSLSYS